jgi:hypothetical protein
MLALAYKATPFAALIGAVAIAVVDGSLVGQAIIAAIVISGYVANRLTVKRTADSVAAKVDTAAEVQQKQIQEVHVLVNSQMTAALARIDELEKALKIRSGEKPPP